MNPYDEVPSPPARTLIEIPHQDFASFAARLRDAVEATFPGFGYTPAESERFLRLNAEPYDDVHYVFQEGETPLAVAMRCGDLVEYVIPTVWERRYEIVAHTLAAPLETRPALHLNVREDLPSHNSWYAALLPALDFDMRPRFRMAGKAASLTALETGHADPRYRLVPMEPRWTEEVVALYLGAYGIAGMLAEEMEEKLRESLEDADQRENWVVAFHEDALVGSCFGSHYRERLFIEELAVAESHRRHGLGRGLLLETVRRLAGAFPQAEAAVLDVDRMNVAAVRLYFSLGFSTQARYIVART